MTRPRLADPTSPPSPSPVAEELGPAASWVRIEDLIEWAGNPRRNAEAVAQVAKSIQRFGFGAPIVANVRDRVIIAGHTRLLAARSLGMVLAPVRWLDLSPAEARALALADNRLGDIAEWDDDALALALQELRASDETLLAETGFSPDELASLLGDPAPPSDGPTPHPPSKLADRFLVPPFSVLNAREGVWLQRKAEWLALGLRSELGRGGNLSSLSGAIERREAIKKGLTMASLSGRVPDYYRQKTEAEARLGRDLSPEEFQADHLVIPEGGGLSSSGTSVFDPVLCELAYRWFCPPGGTVLDPFAGGSVRGIVAAALGRRYIGIELRPEQVEANVAQWAEVSPRVRTVRAAVEASSQELQDSPDGLSPVELRGPFWFKRDDLFAIAGVAGGKARTCWALAAGAPGLVTAGSRSSPQANIVAQVAKRLDIPCQVHTPTGELSPELLAARAGGAEVVQHKAGYNAVIVARARESAKALGWVEVPFGMECEEAVRQTRSQVANVPAEVERLVVPVGSGMSLSGILRGLDDCGLDELRVLGVVVGADPTARLDRYAPANWRDRVELVPSGSRYDAPAAVTVLEGVDLDPHYEAKCLPFLRPGDLLWCVGIRATARRGDPVAVDVERPAWVVGDSREVIPSLPEGELVDLVFSCPPYGDLEVYSDDPADLSAMDPEAFLVAYRDIIRKACDRLRDDRFAVWVVGEFRDRSGAYRDFVGETVQAFRDAGLAYYNEAVLVTPLGSVPVRAGRFFTAARKLGKTHQNVLVFVKGDWRRAVAACGTVDVSDALQAVEDRAQAEGVDL